MSGNSVKSGSTNATNATNATGASARSGKFKTQATNFDLVAWLACGPHTENSLQKALARQQPPAHDELLGQGEGGSVYACSNLTNSCVKLMHIEDASEESDESDDSECSECSGCSECGGCDSDESEELLHEFITQECPDKGEGGYDDIDLWACARKRSLLVFQSNIVPEMIHTYLAGTLCTRGISPHFMPVLQMGYFKEDCWFVMPRFDGVLLDLPELLGRSLTVNECDEISFVILHTLAIMQQHFGLIHYDMLVKNIGVVLESTFKSSMRSESGEISQFANAFSERTHRTYRVDDDVYELPPREYILKLYDFGLSQSYALPKNLAQQTRQADLLQRRLLKPLNKPCAISGVRIQWSRRDAAHYSFKAKFCAGWDANMFLNHWLTCMQEWGLDYHNSVTYRLCEKYDLHVAKEHYRPMTPSEVAPDDMICGVQWPFARKPYKGERTLSSFVI